MKSPLLIAFFLLMFTMQLSQAQAKKIEYYANGQNGIELISKSKFGLTVIISTYNAKLKIKDEVAKLFYERYQKNNNINDSVLKIKTKEALVIGKCKITKKAKVSNVDFYYQRVEWNSGLIEEYKK